MAKVLVVKFEIPGATEPQDVLVTFLDTQFHLHSSVLRKHSGFFRRDFDLRDAQQTPKQTSQTRTQRRKQARRQFRYAYKWDKFEIRGENAVLPGTPIEVSVGPKMLTTSLAWRESFQIMLSAVYESPITYRHMADVMLVSDLAKFYDVDPIVFESFNKYISQSLILLGKMDEGKRIDILLRAASFLRHATLFRESIVYAVAYWPGNEPRSGSYPLLKATCPNLHHIAFLSWTRVNQLRAKVDHEILVRTKIDRCLYDVVSKVGRNFASDPNAMQEARYYRALLQELSHLSFASKAFHIRMVLHKLLRNHLRFDTAKKVHGLSPHSHRFLCAEVADEELPWNKTSNIGTSDPEPTSPS